MQKAWDLEGTWTPDSSHSELGGLCALARPGLDGADVNYPNKNDKIDKRSCTKNVAARRGAGTKDAFSSGRDYHVRGAIVEKRA